MANCFRWVGLAAVVLLEACGGGSGSSTSVVPPSGLSYASPQTYYVGAAIQALTPTVSGSVTSYAVSPPLPAGLTLSPSTGVISGTPTAATATTAFTVTARNSAGQSAFGLSITVGAVGVALLSGDISRHVVSGSSVSVDVSIRIGFAVPGDLHATATDATGVFLPGVTVLPAGTGVYTLELTTSTTAAVGAHSASVTLNLCEDAACHTPARVPSIAVPFSVNVMTPTSAWPGDNLATLSPWTGVADWTTFQGNAAHTGYVPVTVKPDWFSTRWQKPATAPAGLGQAYYNMLNSVTTSGGQLFSAEGKLLLVRREVDGSTAWSHDFSDLEYASTNPPAVADGTVYITAGQQSSVALFAFDAANGTQRFKSPMQSQWERYLAPTIGPRGIYTQAGLYGAVYGIDTAGNQLFQASSGPNAVTPTVDRIGVYWFDGRALGVFEPSTGIQLATINDPTWRGYAVSGGGSPVLVAPGSVVVANYGGAITDSGILLGNTLLDIDVIGGTVKWQVPGYYPITPAYRAGMIYAANDSPLRLEARSETDGSLSWSWAPPQAGDTRFTSEVLVTDNLAFLCTNLALYAIDLATHKTVWSYPIVGRLALSAQGVLYVAGQTMLTAFNLGGAGGGEHVQPPTRLSYPSPQTFYSGAAIQALSPTVTGAVSSYSVSPALPAGLALDPATGVISGTPTTATVMGIYTVTAQSSAGQATFGLSIAVVAQRATLLSGDIARTVVLRVPVPVDVSIQMNFSVPATLYAQAADPDGVFASSVSVLPGDGGVYTLELTTSVWATAGLHTSAVSISLCEDAACTTPAKVPPITVPFSVNVMTSVSAWPGDNLTALSPWPEVPDWTMYQGNAAHTGYVPVTLDPNRFATRWQRPATRPYNATPGSYFGLNSVTTSGGLIFDAEGKELLASREDDGVVVWRHNFGDLQFPSTNPPSVSGGVVYIAAGQQSSTFFFGFDATSGAQRFQSPMTSQWERYLAPTIGASGIYTDAGVSGGLYAFDTAGSQIFFSQEAQMELWTPAVDATGVYTYTGSWRGGQLRVVDPLTGAVRHSITDPTFLASGYALCGSPVLGALGSVFVANYCNGWINSGTIGNKLLNFDVTTDSIKWQVSGAFTGTPAYHAGTLYAASYKPLRLDVRSETDGALLWSWAPPQASETYLYSEVLVTDNLAFVCTDLALYAIDLTTHKTVWSYPIVGRLALSAQGVLYVAGESTLTAFNVK